MKNILRVEKIFIVVWTIFFVWSCTEPTEKLLVHDYAAYFPINESHVQYYEVTEINIDAPLEIYDTTVYYLKIVADSIYYKGDTLYGNYSRWKSPIGENNYVVQGREVRELKSPVGYYIEKRDNCRKIKARLPLRLTDKWNPNIYCISSTTTRLSEIKALDIPKQIEGLVYDSVVHVVNQYDSSLIHLDIQQEYYAVDFGMLYYEQTTIVSNSADLDFTLPIRERVVVGQMVEMRQIFPQ